MVRKKKVDVTDTADDAVIVAKGLSKWVKGLIGLVGLLSAIVTASCWISAREIEKLDADKQFVTRPEVQNRMAAQKEMIDELKHNQEKLEDRLHDVEVAHQKEKR